VTVYKYRDVAAANMLKITAGERLGVENHWELVRGNIVYQADANAANRQVYLYTYGVDSNVQGDELESIAITANQTKEIILSRVTDRNNMKSTSSEFEACIHPLSFFIHGLQYFLMTIISPQAGDRVTYSFEWRWLNWDLGLEAFTGTTPPVTPDEPKNWWEWLWHG